MLHCLKDACCGSSRYCSSLRRFLISIDKSTWLSPLFTGCSSEKPNVDCVFLTIAQ